MPPAKSPCHPSLLSRPPKLLPLSPAASGQTLPTGTSHGYHIHCIQQMLKEHPLCARCHGKRRGCQGPSSRSQQREGIQRAGGPHERPHAEALSGPFSLSLSLTSAPRGWGRHDGWPQSLSRFESPSGRALRRPVIVAVFLTSFSFLSRPCLFPS